MKILIVPSHKKAFSDITSPILKTSEITHGSYANLKFEIKNNHLSITHNEVDLKEFDFIWLNSNWKTRDLAYAISLYLDKMKVKYTKVEKCTSKLSDLVTLCLNKIPSPDTIFRPIKLSKVLLNFKSEIKLPVVIKSRYGYGGHGVKLVHNFVEIPENSSMVSLIQKYIPNEYEWGILYSNGKIVSCEKSYKKSGEFRNNASQGAKEEFVDVAELKDEIKNLVIKTAKILELDWCRIDVLENETTGEVCVLEVNRFPGITIDSTEQKAVQEFVEKIIKSR